MYKIIQEGKAKIYAPVVCGAVSRKMGVFYNPRMKMNRDISVMLLNASGNKDMMIADILAGSGVRSIRFAKELRKGKIKEIWINDKSADAVKLIKKNLRLNKLKESKNMKITNKDASVFLLESKGFDYIDVDPFGTPNPFLDAAVRRLGRDGILAVTATDTACLSGSVPKACLRKYWALPSDGHETGIRILIRKVQLIGAQYSKALLPIFSYAFEHYFRVFFRCVKGKKDVDAMLKLHGMHNGAGPLWLGTLWDAELAENIYNIAGEENGIRKFLWLIKNEAKVDAIGFYDINEICGRYKLHAPNKQELIARIKSFGYDAAETHFSGTGIRSGIPEEELIRAIKRIKF